MARRFLCHIVPDDRCTLFYQWIRYHMATNLIIIHVDFFVTTYEKKVKLTVFAFRASASVFRNGHEQLVRVDVLEPGIMFL